jgi:hypothetical protein
LVVAFLAVTMESFEDFLAEERAHVLLEAVFLCVFVDDLCVNDIDMKNLNK